MNFYQQTSNAMQYLNLTERNILVYIMKNIDKVKKMAIRDLADACFVSTTTIFRFVQKIGYEGYSDFIYSLIESGSKNKTTVIPDIVQQNDYFKSYINNIGEAVNILTDEKIDSFKELFKKAKRIHIIAEGMSREVGGYVYRLLSCLNYNVVFPKENYEKNKEYQKLSDDDMVLALSYSGDNKSVILEIEKIMQVSNPNIVSITRADNNAIQNMSDLNFYMFADEISFEENDITSRVGMIAILELLIYSVINK